MLHKHTLALPDNIKFSFSNKLKLVLNSVSLYVDNEEINHKIKEGQMSSDCFQPAHPHIPTALCSHNIDTNNNNYWNLYGTFQETQAYFK